MVGIADVRRAARFIESDPPQATGFWGRIFGGINWVQVVLILFEIFKRLLEKQGLLTPPVQLGPSPDERLDAATLARIDREFPR